MNILVSVSSATALKNVNWRHGSLQPYAVVWIDSSEKYSTETDLNNGVNPIWDEKFTITLPSTSDPESAILFIDILHANPDSGTKPLVGSTMLPLKLVLDQLDKVPTKCKARFDLILERSSGRPQGNLKIKIKVKESNTSKQEARGKQANVLPESQSQPQPQSYYQSQYHIMPQPPMNNQNYPNRSNPYVAGYPPYSPQAERPNQGQAPVYANSVEDIESTARASESLDAAYAKARLEARARLYALSLI
jgi:C2 domain